MYENKKFTDMVSDCILELTSKKLPSVKCWYIMKEYPQLPELANKIFLAFPATYMCEGGFSSYFSPRISRIAA